MAGADQKLAEISKPPKFRFEYYSERPPYWGYDGLPFGAFYAVALAVVVALVIRKGTVAFEHGLCASVPVVLHVLLFLLTQWSVDILCLVKFKQEKEIDKATHVKVLPLVASKSGGRRQVLLVPVVKESEEVSILYHKKKFRYNRETGRLERLKFQITLPLKVYLESTGLTDKSAKEMSTKYGCNTFDIPLPTFAELFKEHAVAPFFVFQVFCVTLWLLDEYWYYSLLTLFMLIVLEAQMVHRRRSDLSELREMRIPPRPVQVYRDANWRCILSDQLIPGDILALMRKADAPMPCDVLLLQGSVLVNEAMLTGESVPQMKVAASPAPGSPELEAPLDMKGLHKQHVVSAGTHVMLHQNTTKAKGFKKVPSTSSSPAAVGYVLRTGFDTTQGKLCRTILFSAERVTVSSREAYYFLAILVAFALGACAYVLYDGLVLVKERPEEKERSTFKLFLSVSHILTSVVPPEFPIMLSLAVNLSLVALVRKRIFCTEPFRVPLAGKVETCCFDKTGTLTSDSMEVDGVHGLAGFPVPVTEKKKKDKRDKDKDNEEDGGPANVALQQSLPFLSTAVMAACSGLTVVENEVVGDPLEKAALQAVRWHMISPDILVSKVAKGADRLTVLRRYPFVSELQRMSVLVRHLGPGAGYQGKEGSTEKTEKRDFDRVLALVKGSCEVLRPRLAKVPDDFSTLQDNLTSSGLRVLCLAAKELPSDLVKTDPEQVDRQDLESELEFCGLLVLRNSVKQGTVSTVKQLRRCYHRVVMITGDHPLTACQVALSISMAEKPFLMLERRAAGDKEAQNGKNGDKAHPALEWRFQAHSDTGEEKAPLQFKESKIASLARKHSLCIVGKSLSELTEDQISTIAPYVTVFARVSPQQKEEVITALNLQGNTMMVGDGTNDVGALKHAHVGVSLLTSTAPVLPSPMVAEGRRGRPGHPGHPQGIDDQAPLVRLGDASIASPFTYKGDSVKCSMTILRCGRATLSTVLMMYKIMGLNSVMSAFAMSVLTLDGVKLGDGQTAIESLFTSLCFFLVSRSAPAKQLAKMLPTYSVFAWQVMVTLVIQLVVHLSVLLYGWRLANSYRAKDWKRDIEGEFEPNLTNSVVFMLIATMHASSFLANYEGHPFMQPLYANKSLLYSLMFFVSVIFIVASEAIPELNESLSLVVAPSQEFRERLCLLIAADICLSAGLSKAVDWYAIWRRGCAAEKRAKLLGLGMSGGGD